MGSQPFSLAPDAATRRILQSLRAIVRDLRRASVSCEKQFGLSAAQLFVLQALRDQPGMSLGEVAQRTATDSSSVSVVVRKLEEKGLVQKRTSSKDGRRLELSLTPNGRRLSEKSPPAVQDLLIQRIGDLSHHDRRSLAGLLDRIAQPGAGDQPMFFEESPGEAARKGGRP
jgi:MarR family transcriptional regulator, organic hydroperoxide resistance regulator